MSKDQSIIVEFKNPLKDPSWLVVSLVSFTILFITIMIIFPLLVVFVEAFRKGVQYYFVSITEPETVAAFKLTIFVCLIAVPLNAIFGIAASWAIAKYNFPGKDLLVTLIELPLSVSPVIAGFIYITMFGASSALGSWLIDHDIQIIFAVPGIVLATIFESLPYVARELTPYMEEMGNEEEEAGVALGASGWQVFTKITLPKIKWALIYGILLCNARSIGAFGAVSVVSGQIKGLTNTVPLQVEVLYNEYNFAAAFAVASILTFLALLTLAIKAFIERKSRRLTTLQPFE